ncbi:MAG: DinB family protein [Holophagaceae bacterium]|uniref:DinB family protein n=1 Tax=Candidatus Geothrix skivensis TaxID=2954439 RepID=A0A9D7SDL5_9BACT|nr:DinB family protein [Candidatus Geothrix skivensis]
MAASLQALIDALDHERLALLDGVEALGADAISARSQPDTWSILEIVEHLVLAEAAILQGLPPTTELTDRPRSLKQRILFQVVMAILRFGIPVKVPTRRMVPTGQVPLEELRKRWDGHLRWLRTHGEGLDAEGERRAVFQHPVAGPITLAQALRMACLHLGVHRRQIRKRQEGQARQNG